MQTHDPGSPPAPTEAPSLGRRALDAASMTMLLAALALAVPVVERVAAAHQRSRHFHGSGNGGHITLSFETGLEFSGMVMVVLSAALALRYVSHHHGARRARRVAQWAAAVSLVAGGVYWSLATSSLNAWRP